MSHVLVANELLEVSIVCTISDQFTFNVQHVVLDAVTGTVVTDEDFAADYEAQFAPLYKDIMADSGTFYGVKVQVIKPTRFDAQYSIAARGVGTLIGEQLPPQIASVVSLKTGYADRTKMGRMYLPAASEAENDATGRPGAGYLADVQALASSFVAGAVVTVGGGSVSWKPVIYSRKNGTAQLVTYAIVQESWGTLRSRSNLGHLDAAPF